MTEPAKFTVSEFMTALHHLPMDSHYRNATSSSTRAIASVVDEGEPDDMDWVVANLAVLQRRLTERAAHPVKEATAAIYASRVRSAWRALAGVPRLYTSPSRSSQWHENRAPTVGDQVNEALASLTRWPALRPYLLPALAQAILALEGSTKAPE